MPELLEEELIESALPWVDQIAGTVCWQLGHNVHVDDLRSMGHFALTDLVRRYDPKRAPFEPFMRLHLRWAMLDGVRRAMHLRAINARAKALVASEHLVQARDGVDAPPSSSNIPPSEGTFNDRLKMVMREHAAAMGISLLTSYGTDVATAPSSGTPERATFKRARFAELRRAVGELKDDTMRGLIERHYFKGQSLAEAASALRISRSWASRLHQQAIKLLERRLRGSEADPASSSPKPD